MNRDEVLTLVREHLAEELEVDIGRISEETRFREDLDADSLDLYELVMELEDRYGVAVSEEQAAADRDRRRRGRLRARARARLSRVAAEPELAGRGPLGADRRAARGAAPAGAHPLLLDRAPDRLLRAARLPRRQRARALGRQRALRALPRRRRRRPDQDPQPGGQRRLLRRGRRASSACRRCCARTSPRTSPRRSRPRSCSTASGRCRRRPRR